MLIFSDFNTCAKNACKRSGCVGIGCRILTISAGGVLRYSSSRQISFDGPIEQSPEPLTASLTPRSYFRGVRRAHIPGNDLRQPIPQFSRDFDAKFGPLAVPQQIRSPIHFTFLGEAQRVTRKVTQSDPMSDPKSDPSRGKHKVFHAKRGSKTRQKTKPQVSVLMPVSA